MYVCMYVCVERERERERGREGERELICSNLKIKRCLDNTKSRCRPSKYPTAGGSRDQKPAELHGLRVSGSGLVSGFGLRGLII